MIESTEANAFNLTGDGETIAIIDTGVDAGHPFFGGRVVNEACFSENWNCPGPPDLPTCAALPSLGDNWVPAGSCPSIAAFRSGAAQPCTFAPISCEHGTHVAGIAAGSNGFFNGASFSGVAPGASIVSTNVYSDENDPNCAVPSESADCPKAHEGDMLAALEYVYDTKSSFDYAAVNMSLGLGVFGPPNCDANFPDFKLIIYKLRLAGIATVASSGNQGNKNGLSMPACISWAVSVGASDKSDNVTIYSNSAPNLDLLAPGGTGVSAAQQVTSSIPVYAGSWGGMQGTSMAAPHVAGAYALMREEDPQATVGGIQNMLKATGVPLVDPETP